MSWGATIYKLGSESIAVDMGTVDEIRKLISDNFPSIIWRKKPWGDGVTAEFGYYNSGTGYAAFGMFRIKAEILKSLDLEIKGDFTDEAFGAICDFCERNGWIIYSDKQLFEDLEASGVIKRVESGDCAVQTYGNGKKAPF